MDIAITSFAAGPLETNTFVLSDENKNALIIDAPPQIGDMITWIKSNDLKPLAVLLTHAHFDHCMGITEIHEAFGAIPVYTLPEEKILLHNPDYNGSPLMGMSFTYTEQTCDLKEGEMSIGSFTFSVLNVYGHSPGGCAFLFGKNCFVGDTLFAGSIGRTDFPGCDGPGLLRNITEKILSLPDETNVYPGHGRATTVKHEKQSNPFFK